MARLEVDRRSFLRTTAASALYGVLAPAPAFGANLSGGRLGASPQVFDFDQVYDRFGTDCTKWDGAVADMGHAIEVGMGVADMDFRAAPCITRALAERCSHENWGYMRRPERYAEAVVDWNHRRHGLEIDPDHIEWTTGVHPGLIAALQTFAPPGTRVLLTTPVYSGFYTDLRFTKTVAEESPLRLVDGRYSIDFEDFERRAARANVFILCNPQNPTGNVWSPADLTRMGEVCLAHRVVVLADEIHCDFVTRGQSYTPFASLPDRAVVDNSLTFKAASKSFSLAAMKVAWYFSTNPDYLERVRANTRADLTTLGMEANYAALTEGEPWLDELLEYVDANHDFAESFVSDRVPHVKYRKAEGTYLAWLDVSDLADRIGARETAARESLTSVDPVTPEDVVQEWVARHAGVFLNPGDGYGVGGAGHMRMNLGTPRSLIELALGNLAAATASV